MVAKVSSPSNFNSYLPPLDWAGIWVEYAESAFLIHSCSASVPSMRISPITPAAMRSVWIEPGTVAGKTLWPCGVSMASENPSVTLRLTTFISYGRNHPQGARCHLRQSMCRSAPQ